MADPKDTDRPAEAEEPPVEPIEDAGPAAAPEDDDAPQPWGAGARLPRKRKTGLWIGFAVLVVIAVGAVAWPVLQQYAPREVTAMLGSTPARPDPAVAALGVRMDRLEAEVAQLDSALATRPSGGGPAMAELQADLSRLDSRIGALESRPAPSPAPTASAPTTPGIDPETFAALANRVAAMEQAAAATAAGGEDRAAALAKRVDELETKLAADTGAAARDRTEAALARVSAENERLAAAIARTGERITALDGRLEQAKDAEAARAKLRDALAALAGRLSEIETKAARLADADLTRRGDALLLAIGQLRDAVAGPRPFASELDAVLRIAGEETFIREATAPIAPRAATGIPTVSQLQARFPALATKAAQAVVAPEEGSWVSRTAARLARVVTVRRVGEDADGETAMAALARAEARLADRDLGGAAAALEPLSGKPAQVLAEWRADAGARAAAEAAIARLSDETIARLARAAKSAGPGADGAANTDGRP